MSNTLKTRIVIRNDTTAAWEAANPVLLKGEMGIEYDTNKFKIGDGVTAWNSLGYAPEIDASAVTLTKDITATYAFGKYSPDSTGSVNIPAEGKTLEEFLQNALAEEKDPVITKPSIAIKLNEAKGYEVGTKVTPSWTLTKNKGKYSYGPNPTGVEFPGTGSIKNGETVVKEEASDGKGTELTVSDGMNYKLTVTANYTKGNNPLTNLGNAKPALAIAAGTATATSAAITGYRSSFYGAVATQETITSAIVRGLAGKSTSTLGAGAQVSAVQKVGDNRVIIAVPQPRTIKSILNVAGMNAESISAFKTLVVEVQGANGYTAAKYNVYYCDFANAASAQNTWKATLA